MLEYNQDQQRPFGNANNETAVLVNKLFQKDELLRYIKNRLDGELDKYAISVNTIEEIIRSIEQHLGDDNDIKDFITQFDKVHDNFLNRFKEKYPSIDGEWIMICAYLKMKKSKTEISFLMNIPIEILEIRLLRLKNNLELSPDVDLAEFINNF
jgi:DNA mismatch repair ATPase MutS